MNNPDGFWVVFVTAANTEEAEEIAQVLVEERLAACVNVVGGCRSVYRWKGELVKDDEVLMIIKTSRRLFPALETRIAKIHSYENPEVIAVELSGLSEAYGTFLRDSIG